MIDKDERVRLIKVVEYLEPTMAEELLCKFPHSYTFDFDYTQSSIWSPIAPRAFKSLPSLEMDRVLGFNSDEEEEKKAATPPSLKQRKRLFCSYGIGLANKKTPKRVSKTNALNLSFVSNIHKKIKCNASVARTLKSSKGWDVVLKAASKHFKKTKKKDQIVHVKL